ncbi:MAG TPA: FAD-binding oxidoreductase [Flavitalea sp.]|nr:FAD-binding oxidoreductase [Flavitalea sp.]
MMQVDYLIIGQGISGTMLSYQFTQAGLSFVVLDDENPAAPSRVAAGMINPVTGRRIVKTWMIDTLLPFAYDTYRAIGEILQIKAINETPIIDFFPTKQMQAAFLERAPDIPEYLHEIETIDELENFFRFNYGYGIINPAYTVNSRELLPAWRNQLKNKGQLIQSRFIPELLQFTSDGIRYESIHASRIIYCDGNIGAQYSWFRNLPFAENKGQALIIQIDGLTIGNIFAKGLKILPLGNELFWVGSSYEWDFTEVGPTTDFREKTMLQLNDWLKISYKLVDHVAALRPATLERRPFVGFHPHEPRIGIFNGMGTKGFSLAPYFAKQFANHILAGDPIDPAVDIRRFSKVLAREVG